MWNIHKFSIRYMILPFILYSTTLTVHLNYLVIIYGQEHCWKFRLSINKQFINLRIILSIMTYGWHVLLQKNWLACFSYETDTKHEFTFPRFLYFFLLISWWNVLLPCNKLKLICKVDPFHTCNSYDCVHNIIYSRNIWWFSKKLINNF